MTFRRLALALAGCTALCAGPAPAQVNRDRLPQVYTVTPTGVNLQSGLFLHSRTDFSMGSLSFVRSWGTVPAFPVDTAHEGDPHDFGGWNHNFGFGVGNAGTGSPIGVSVHADGKTYQFELYGTPGNYVWVPHNIDQFNNSAWGTSLTGGDAGGGNLVFRNRNGDVYTMNANRQADNVVHADGTRLDFSYDSSKRLRTILSNRGDAIVLDYGSGGDIATACAYNRAVTYVTASSTCSGAPIQASYSYSSGLLSSVTDPGGQATGIQYLSGWVSCITIPDSSTCEVTNYSNPLTGEPAWASLGGQVRTQTMATGEVWTFGYTNNSMYEFPPEPGEIRRTRSGMVDPGGFVTQAIYANGLLEELVERSGRTLWTWSGLDLESVTYPRGNKVLMAYDDRGNLTSLTRRAIAGSGLADITVSYTYPTTTTTGGQATGCSAASQRLCNKPLTRTDERNNVTEYTYSADHGGVLTETGPAPTSGAPRPQTRYTYAQRYAWIKNSGGSYVQAATPVWLLATELRCITSAAHSSGTGCTASSNEVVTTYDYGPDSGPNVLQLRGVAVTGPSGSGSVTSRICYTYDPLGNRISETGPGAGLTSCP